MTDGSKLDGLSCLSLITRLQIDIERAKKLPPFRKLAAAECALATAVALLRLLDERLAAIEKDLNE